MSAGKLSARKQKMYRAKRDSMQEIAVSRIDELFRQAHKIFPSSEQLAARYVLLARKVSSKFKVGFRREQKLQFCKNCGSYLVQGTNATVRLSKGNIVIKCLKCNTIKRLKYR